MLSASIGRANVFDEGRRPTRFGVEFSLRPVSRWALTPAVGAILAQNESRYVYVAMRREFWLNHRWAVIPSFGVGAYQDGGGLDLGGALEFRTGLEIARRFGTGIRVGAGLFHVSNSGLSERNPGSESVALSVTMPMGRTPGRSR